MDVEKFFKNLYEENLNNNIRVELSNKIDSLSNFLKINKNEIIDEIINYFKKPSFLGINYELNEEEVKKSGNNIIKEIIEEFIDNGY